VSADRSADRTAQGADQTPVNGSVTDKSLADLVTRISEDASTLVREEIELAKAEIELKVKRIAQGAIVGAAAGFFVFLALIFAFHALAWGINDIFDNWIWQGFAIVTGILLLLGALSGFIAMRAFKAGTPPTPEKAIEEAKLIREALERSEGEAAAARTDPEP
jgi:uncharacterized membrane protein YqjE